MARSKKKSTNQQKLALKRRKIAVSAHARDFPERLPPRDDIGRFRKRKKRAS